MERENINTFNKNVEEIGRSEGFNDLLYSYFEFTDDGAIVWKKRVPEKIRRLVTALARQYLV